MHVPDGYLSPSTCAALYGASAPFWGVALRRMRAALSGRTIPLVAVFAAFSFVVMMFNLPLPGGTTGHATGIAIAAIVLGPWGATLAISVALFIQALFFGDGGVLTFGANAFNMAVAGTFVSSGAFRLIAGRSQPPSRRRIVGAAVAGYLAVNVAALLAAVELGLQPMLFHDAHGTPLYAPYPLKIAVPAVMLGHLLVIGVAEAFLTAGIVRYMQRSDWAQPIGSVAAASLSLPSERMAAALELRRSSSALRGAYAALAVLLILTPLGLVAGGSAWGEWRASEFNQARSRAAIAAVSGNVSPPSAPAGMARLSSVWRAPLHGYAPEFLRNETLGYVFSAMVGAGLILLAAALLPRVKLRG